MGPYRFVLVHGAWHDGTAWSATAARLRELGHEVWTPTIAGNGKGADKNVTHDECVASIVDYVAANDLRDIVFVGHSFGGSIISRAAPVIAARLRRLVFWNAFVPADGMSVVEDTPGAPVPLDVDRAAGGNTITLPFAFWRECMINDADLDTAKWAYEQLSPQPFGPLSEKLDMTAFYALLRSGRMPCSFLNCTEDGTRNWHPGMSSRLGWFRLVQMPGSHEVLFTNPRGLAEKLVEAGRD